MIGYEIDHVGSAKSNWKYFKITQLTSFLGLVRIILSALDFSDNLETIVVVDDGSFVFRDNHDQLWFGDNLHLSNLERVLIGCDCLTGILILEVSCIWIQVDIDFLDNKHVRVWVLVKWSSGNNKLKRVAWKSGIEQANVKNGVLDL